MTLALRLCVTHNEHNDIEIHDNLKERNKRKATKITLVFFQCTLQRHLSKVPVNNVKIESTLNA